LTKDVGIEYILFLDPASEDAGDERNSEDGQPLNGDDLQQTFEDV
jgi:hypothetical protein